MHGLTFSTKGKREAKIELQVEYHVWNDVPQTIFSTCEGYQEIKHDFEGA